MSALKNILVPTDFSEYSLGVIDRLDLLYAAKDAKVVLLHVLTENILAEPYADPYLAGGRPVISRVEGAELRLKVIAGERLAGVGNVECVVRRGDPASEIVRLAEHHKVGVILMATHGRTGLAHILLGSVAEKVVRSSHVPVLTVRPPEICSAAISEEDVREQLHIT